MLNKIKKYDYASFDIFDTLVLRDIPNPEDIFELVEQRYNEKNNPKITNFKHNRIQAQQFAHQKSNTEETPIDAIYQVLKKNYSHRICDKLQKIEKQLEIEICVPNQEMQKIFNSIPSKKIIITSDMYLDEHTVRSILNKCGYKQYKKLYLSSTYQKRKSSGTLYRFLLDDLNVNKRQVIHVGDNLISDFAIPRLLGIKALRYKKHPNHPFIDKRAYKHDKDYRILSNFIANHSNGEQGYFHQMGYSCFGPILYGFISWLNKRSKSKKIFFLARDGYIMQKAQEIMYPKSQHSYFYASRRALIVPTLWMNKDIKSMLDKFYIRDSIQIERLFNKLGLNTKQYEAILKKHHFALNDSLKYTELLNNQKFLTMFEEIKPIIHKNSRQEYQLLLQYMEQEQLQPSSIIVDIGWNGNMQKALSDIFCHQKRQTNLSGFYFGILPESKNINQLDMHGFLFSPDRNPDVYLCLKSINSIFESMFLAPHGSVKKFKKNKNGHIEPVLLKYEYDKGVEQDAYKQIQNGALQFIKDFHSSSLSHFFSISARSSFISLAHFAYHPTMKDVTQFGDFKFLEDDIIYLAKPQHHYLTHPQNFIHDLYTSGWVIGFMKRLTHINPCYKQLYLLLIKPYLKKRSKEQQ